MFCRFFKIKEAKQIKQETRNFGKIANARAKNLRAFAIFSEVSGFLLDLLCFLDLEKSTKHPHTVWQPLINGRATSMIFGKIVVPFVFLAPSACVVEVLAVFATRAKLYFEAPHLESHYLSAQDVLVPSRRHNENGKPRKFVEFAGIALKSGNSLKLRVSRFCCGGASERGRPGTS